MSNFNFTATITPFVGGLAIGAIVVAGCANLITGEPLYVNGQPFGFLGKYQEATKALESESESTAKLTQALREANSQIRSLSAENASLLQEKKAAAQHASTKWSPVEKIIFFDSGEYFAYRNKRNKNGRWSAPDSEVTFKLISLSSSEAVFETNMKAPDNQLSFIKGDSSWYTWRGKDWEYAFSVEFNPTNDRIDLRVDRRPKQPTA